MLSGETPRPPLPTLDTLRIKKLAGVVPVSPLVVRFSMLSVPFSFVESLAADFGAVECFWRESDRAFTGFVAHVWFESLLREFVARWATVVGYSVVVRCVSAGSGRFAVSVPVEVPAGEVRLGWVSRGSRVQLVR